MNSIILNGPIITKVFQNSGFSQSQAFSNLSNAEKIYSKVPNSINNYSSNVGLVVGKVQSGKTANVIALSGLAFDNDCKLIIMYLSDTTNLLDQNYDRIVSSFNNINDVLVFKQSQDGDFSGLDSESLNKLYNRGKKIIVCSLKHYVHLNAITEKIKNTKYASDYSIIIDDEGDDISQNTAKEKFSVDEEGFSYEKLRSTNNAAIIEMKNVLSNNGYISLTATPEAPIFLQKFQELSPNYCVTMQPGKGYTGLLTFHGLDSKYVVEIDDYQCLTKDSGLPNSLLDAVAFYFAGCIYRKKNKFVDDVHSMMIHPAKELVSHDNVIKKLKQRMLILQRNIENNDQSGIDFFELVRFHYKSISLVDDITIEELIDVFDYYQIININGDSTEKNMKKLTMRFPYNIFVGGDLLDRGITIPNLAVSYIIRDSKKGQVDTLLQRARWFGYKSDYLNTCKIYMPSSLSNKYNEIIDTEESLWDFLDECSEMNYDMQNCNFSLNIDSSILVPTSGSKASFEFGLKNVSAIKQQKNFTINSNLNNENIKLVNSIDWNNSNILEFNKVQKHRYVDLNLTEISEFIDKYNFSEYSNSDDSLNKEIMLKYINDNIAKYGNTVSLIDMRYESKEERSVYDENYIRNLLQGRSEGKTTEEEGYYYGDRYLPQMRDKISIQIHHVLLKLKGNSDYYNNNDEVVMLVLCMPKKFIVKNYVTRKDISNINRIYD